ncbi:Fructokinase-2 [Carex littledalei]|uniref:Fructokinase-2 n=1 Tax=Carex littledalei TaxID=544730 RepID=A0A833R1R5_9POAL|nr:Fructokinase-2 [Carex littledalei]
MFTADLKYIPASVPNEEKLRKALRFSNACGAICATQKGVIPALPTSAVVEELIASANQPYLFSSTKGKIDVESKLE